VDADVAQWFRKKKNGSAQLNEFLRGQMEAEKRPPVRKRKVGR